MISIHASTQEATKDSRRKGGNLKFQSTLPRRKRPKTTYVPGRYMKISIHASTQEATAFAMGKNAIQQISIHASTQEATWMGLWPADRSLYFNPRFHAGSDSNYRQILSITFVHFAYFFSSTCYRKFIIIVFRIIISQFPPFPSANLPVTPCLLLFRTES